ncbi:jacalin-related lectin 5-like [Cucurbita maxima]|uniref:Jacalin-related lectin 5-like n=1 Tax=Cucurbita maxima TaxID=3661 RepID=A0A6J1I742_CUCMA|nr:jacalin-related lectin 5-like [Cucurbita maxima]
MDSKSSSGGSKSNDGSAGQAHNSTRSGSNSSGKMVAPGSGGTAHISRDASESNPQGYFANLHAAQKNQK